MLTKQGKKSVTNTLTGVKYDTELFFLIKREQFGLFLYKIYLHVFMLHNKCEIWLTEKYVIRET